MSSVSDLSKHLNLIVCAANPAGSADATEALLKAAEEVEADAVALVGDLQGDGGRDRDAILKAFARAGLPTYWVPGPGDAPIERLLRESANIEVVAPLLRGVHGTAAFAGSHLVFAGFGGAVSDDPDAPRDEIDRLSYARWEPEYRLKVIRELDEHQLALLFATPPSTRADEAGSEVLGELVGTYRPRLVVCGGDQRQSLIGRSLVVAPGSLKDGDYAVVDVHEQSVRFERLATTAASL
jgi:uncharacterized protein